MNAQEKLLEYGKELKEKSNMLDGMEVKEILGKAIAEGICYKRSGGTSYSCKINRTGSIITVTESISTPTHAGVEVNSEVVLTINL